MGNLHSKCSDCLSTTSSDRKIFSNFHLKKRSLTKKKILLLGLDGVGKTHLFNRLVSNKNQSFTHPTIGYNVETIKIHSHKFTLWDCGGHPSIRSLWSYHLPNTSLLLWLINIHDRSRLELNLQLISKFLNNQISILIILYDHLFDNYLNDENCLTNHEVTFRFLSILSPIYANTLKWKIISINSQTINDLKKLQRVFIEFLIRQ